MDFSGSFRNVRIEVVVSDQGRRHAQWFRKMPDALAWRNKTYERLGLPALTSEDETIRYRQRPNPHRRRKLPRYVYQSSKRFHTIGFRIVNGRRITEWLGTFDTVGETIAAQQAWRRRHGLPAIRYGRGAKS